MSTKSKLLGLEKCFELLQDQKQYVRSDKHRDLIRDWIWQVSQEIVSLQVQLEQELSDQGRDVG